MAQVSIISSIMFSSPFIASNNALRAQATQLQHHLMLFSSSTLLNWIDPQIAAVAAAMLPSIQYEQVYERHDLRKMEWEFWQPTQSKKMEIGIKEKYIKRLEMREIE